MSTIRYRLDDTGLSVDIHMSTPSEGFKVHHQCVHRPGSNNPPFVALTFEEYANITSKVDNPYTPCYRAVVTAYLERGDIVALQTQLSHMLGELDMAQKE